MPRQLHVTITGDAYDAIDQHAKTAGQTTAQATRFVIAAGLGTIENHAAAHELAIAIADHVDATEDDQP